MRVAFIGLGAMGGGMAANQAKAGREVAGLRSLAGRARPGRWRRLRHGRLRPPRRSRTPTWSSPCCRPGAHVQAVYARARSSPTRAKGALLIDCSTIDVESAARRWPARRPTAGFVFADAPVSGGTTAADAGTLAFMVGCDEDRFAAIEAVIGPMARAVIHAGDAGAGQAAKICNNMVLGISMLGVCEAFALAEKLGLDAAAVLRDRLEVVGPVLVADQLLPLARARCRPRRPTAATRAASSPP